MKKNEEAAKAVEKKETTQNATEAENAAQSAKKKLYEEAYLSTDEKPQSEFDRNTTSWD